MQEEIHKSIILEKDFKISPQLLIFKADKNYQSYRIFEQPT